MSDEAPASPAAPGKTSPLLLVGGLVAVTAVGAGGYLLLSNRGAKVDVSGFDIAEAPETRRPVPVASVPAPDAPVSSLGLMQSEEGMSMAAGGPPPDKPEAAPQDKKQKAAVDMNEAIKRAEAKANEFGRRMERQYPSLTQYGKDWNSYPDLNQLGRQWAKDKDSVKFLYGVMKSDNFTKLVQKYSKDPGVRAFVVQGAKEAPGELIGAASGVFKEDGLVNGLVSKVAGAMGLPSSMVAALGDPSKAAPLDEKALIKETMESDAVKKALGGNKELQQQLQNQQLPGQLPK